MHIKSVFEAGITEIPLLFCVFSKVSALNEAVHGSVQSVFKPWEQRLSSSEVALPF